MVEPILADLEGAQQCGVIAMIKYLFAFCLSGSNGDDIVCNDNSLEVAFEKVKEIANAQGTVLDIELSNL